MHYHTSQTIDTGYFEHFFITFLATNCSSDAGTSIIVDGAVKVKVAKLAKISGAWVMALFWNNRAEILHVILSKSTTADKNTETYTNNLFHIITTLLSIVAN